MSENGDILSDLTDFEEDTQAWILQDRPCARFPANSKQKKSLPKCLECRAGAHPDLCRFKGLPKFYADSDLNLISP